MRVLLLLLLVALAGCVEGTEPADPETADTDGDGFTDAAETAAGSDPKNNASVPAQVRISEEVTYANTGMIIGGVEDVATGAGCGAAVPTGTATFTWAISVPEGATAGRVSDLSFTAGYPISMPEGDIYVFDPEGTLLTDSTGAQLPPADPMNIQDTVEAAGNHPLGEYRIEVRGCVGAGEVSMEATATLSYVPGAS
jgi:hypothetical protein